jgi:hypothetical protein
VEIYRYYPSGRSRPVLLLLLLLLLLLFTAIELSLGGTSPDKKVIINIHKKQYKNTVQTIKNTANTGLHLPVPLIYVQNNPPFVSILTQINQLHAFLTNFFKIQVNIIFTFMLRASPLPHTCLTHLITTVTSEVI